MRTIKDKDGQDLNIAGNPVRMHLTHAKFQQIKTDIGFDPMEIGAGNFETFLEVTQKPGELLKMLHIAVGGTFEEFADLMRADALDNAIGAFVEEVADFFPVQQRARFLAMWNAYQEMDAERVERETAIVVEEVQKRADPVFRRQVQTSLNAYEKAQPPTISGAQSTAPPES